MCSCLLSVIPPVYNNHSSTPAAMHGVSVWHEFSEAVTLNTIVRQDQTQNQLRNTLMSMREYKPPKIKQLGYRNFSGSIFDRLMGHIYCQE